VKKTVSLVSLAAVALVACANGERDVATEDDPFTSAVDGGPDTSTHLPPHADAAATGDDAGATDASLDDASLDAKPAVDAAVSGACGSGSAQLGEYATWFGKVNVHHATGGAWLVDTDCTSGADVNTVAYCKKFWPAAVTQIQLAAVSSDAKPFTSGGGVAPACGGLALSPGQVQFACCAP